MHFLFSKIQKTNERKKNYIFRHCRHLSVRTTCTWAMHMKIAAARISLYVFICFSFFWICCVFFSSLLLLAFSLASLHFVVCKLELWIILSGFCCCCCVCLSGGSCDRLFGIYDFNMKTEKWLEHQIHDIHTSDSSNNQIHTFPVIYSVSGYFFFIRFYHERVANTEPA